MTEQSKKPLNWSLIIGLAIPIIMVIFIALSVYLPRIFDSTPAPTVNFLYAENNTYTHKLKINNNKLQWIKSENSSRKNSDTMPTIYLHDVGTNRSTEISFEEAQKLFLDSRKESSDGYSLERSRNNGFFIFNYRNSRNHFLVNGRTAHKLNLEHENKYFYRSLFLGWVINEPN